MVSLLGMRLGKGKQLSVSSHEEIHGMIEDARKVAAAHEIECLGRPVLKQDVVNGLIVWLHTRPSSQQIEVLAEAMESLGDAHVGRSKRAAKPASDPNIKKGSGKVLSDLSDRDPNREHGGSEKKRVPKGRA